MTIVAVAHINIPEYAPRPLAERLHETKASYPSAIITSADRSCLDNLASYNAECINTVSSNKPQTKLQYSTISAAKLGACSTVQRNISDQTGVEQ